MIATVGKTAYLVHLLVWSLPVLTAQLIGIALLYRRRLRRVAHAVLPPVLLTTCWLVVADDLAISSGIWRFGEGKHLGWSVLSVPIEEVLFFLITNLLVGFGLALLSASRLALEPEAQ